MNVESSWTVYRTRFVVRARKLTQPLSFVNALGHEYSGAPGDYLVETSLGCRSILPQVQFEGIYVPLDGAASGAGRLAGGRPVRSVTMDGSVRSLPEVARPRSIALGG